MANSEERVALAEQNAEEESDRDPRLRLIGVYVTLCLKPAAGAWERCAGSTEVEQLLHTFLGRNAETERRPLLLVRSVPGGLAVQPGLDIGPELGSLRSKGLFFLRTRVEPPGPTSLRGSVVCGNLPAAPLAHLAALFSEVRVGVGSPEAAVTLKGKRGE